MDVNWFAVSFFGMPMMLSRAHTRCQMHGIHAKLAQPGSIAQRTTRPPGNYILIFSRINGFLPCFSVFGLKCWQFW